jgi:hypothetical protein
MEIIRLDNNSMFSILGSIQAKPWKLGSTQAQTKLKQRNLCFNLHMVRLKQRFLCFSLVCACVLPSFQGFACILPRFDLYNDMSSTIVRRLNIPPVYTVEANREHRIIVKTDNFHVLRNYGNYPS